MLDYIGVIARTVNHTCRCYDGVPPKRNVALQALIGAALLQKRAFGIDSITKATVAVGVSRSSLQAAATLLESQDNDLIGRVLDSREPLLRAANRVRNRAKLIRAFEDASATDHIAFGAAVGPGVVFDRVVVPAL